MNTPNTNTEAGSRPIGYWLKAVDRLMAADFARAFEREGASRRDWRLLNLVDGTAPSHRPLNSHKLHGLVDRGWVIQDGDTWTLTDEGRAAKERLGDLVANIRATVTDAVSPEELETTISSLSKIARALGWDEANPMPGRHGRGSGRGHKWAHRHGHRGGHAHEHGHGHCGGHAHEHGHGHCGGRNHRAPHDRDHAHGGERAYARGFDAGFLRGRDAS